MASRKVDFVHLHLHTEYSILDSIVKIPKLMEKVKELGMDAVAMTDHGNLFGLIPFLKSAKENGIKPIVGVEFYIAPESRKQKKSDNSIETQKKHYYHLVLIAKDKEGLKNLKKLVSISYLEGFYYKPRIDKEVLKEHSKGLIATTACIAGEIQQYLLLGDYKKAKEIAGEYKEIFGEDFYLEIQNHGKPEEIQVIPQMIQLSKELGIKIIATNDVHYINKEDWELHDVLLCVQTGKKLSDPDRMKYEPREFYLKSFEEMQKLFKEVPYALSNTLEVAEKTNIEFETGENHLPKYTTPDGQKVEDADAFLRELAIDGLKKKFNGQIPKEYMERLEMELEMIKRMGFSNYFLVVQDYVNWAKREGIIVGPGRGSAAGSLVSYAIGITNIDPIKYDLLFERFLNPERVTMPDIDVDFEDTRRDDVINYIKRRYGEDAVANIITFGTMKSRAVIRDVARVLDIPLQKADEVAKSIPREDKTLEELIDEVPKLKEIMEKGDEKEKKWIKYATKLEGTVRQTGLHASGIVVADRPLRELVALYKDPKEGIVAVQVEGAYLEDIGLLKMDVLGLANLTMIKNTLKLIKERYGKDIDIFNLPLDDPKVYELLSSGETDGVFQVEGEGMKEMLKNMKPNRFEDIIAALALYRPGPLNSGMDKDYINRKNGKEEIKYPHPDLEPVLKETYGVILYQEQIMKIAQIIAGFTLGQADELRKAIGKKKKEVMEKMKEKFIEGGVKNGYDRDFVVKLYEMIEKFAEYGFNKSHSASYALITYITAWLKAYYPLEFMTALLNTYIDKSDDVEKYTKVCKKMGIKVLPPDVNRSDAYFRIEGDAIRFGLGAIKGVGISLAEQFTQLRGEYDKFKTIEDFFDLAEEVLKKNQIEALIKAGALDGLYKRRDILLQNLESLIQEAQNRKKAKISGQIDLFGSPHHSSHPEIHISSLPKDTNITEKLLDEYLRMEKEVLGFFLTTDPFENYKHIIEKYSTLTPKIASLLKEGIKISIFGILHSIKLFSTKLFGEAKTIAKGKLLGIDSSEIPVFIPADVYASYQQLVTDDLFVYIKGVIEKNQQNEEKIIRVSEIILPSSIQTLKAGELHLTFKNTISTANGFISGLSELKKIIEENKGACIIYSHIIDEEEAKSYRFGPVYALKVTPKVHEWLNKYRGKIFLHNWWV